MSDGERQTLAIRLYDNWQVTNTSDSLEIYCYEQGRKDGYDKAIDDFIKFANTMPTVETDDGEIRPMWLEEMAEQLKAGGNIELSEHSESQGNRTGK